MTKTKTIPLNHGVKRKLAVLWSQNINEWKRYHTIRNHLKNFPEFRSLSERTIFRYLNQLVQEGFLEKHIEPTHHTLYKPKSLEALIPIIFSIKSQSYATGLKMGSWKVQEAEKTVHLEQTLENELANTPIKERLQIIARRLFARALFGLLQTLKTNNPGWFENVSFNLSPELLLQLGLFPHGTAKMQYIGEHDKDTILKANFTYQLNTDALEKTLAEAFPEEYKQLQQILTEIQSKIS